MDKNHKKKTAKVKIPSEIAYIVELSALLEKYLADEDDDDDNYDTISKQCSLIINEHYKNNEPKLIKPMLAYFNDKAWKSDLFDLVENIIINIAYLSQDMGLNDFLSDDMNFWLDKNLKWIYIYHLDLKTPHNENSLSYDDKWNLMNLMVPIGSIPNIRIRADRDGNKYFLTREDVRFYYRQDVVATIKEFQEKSWKNLDQTTKRPPIATTINTIKSILFAVNKKLDKIPAIHYRLTESAILQKEDNVDLTYVGKICNQLKENVVIYSYNIVNRELLTSIVLYQPNGKNDRLQPLNYFSSRHSDFLFFICALDSILLKEGIFDTSELAIFSRKVSNFNPINAEDISKIKGRVERVISTLAPNVEFEILTRASIASEDNVTHPKYAIKFPINIVKIV